MLLFIIDTVCQVLHIGHVIVLYTLCWDVADTVLVFLYLEWFIFPLSLPGTLVHLSGLRSSITFSVKLYGTALFLFPGWVLTTVPFMPSIVLYKCFFCTQLLWVARYVYMLVSILEWE